MSISIDLTEGQINNAIAVALAESFSGERRDALIRDVIRAHLAYRENSYDKETLLSKQVGQRVRQIASERLKLAIDEQFTAPVSDVIRETIGPQFVEKVVAQVRTALQNMRLSNIGIKAEAYSELDEED